MNTFRKTATIALSSLSLLAASATFAPEARAESTCSSGLKVANAIFAKWGEQLKKLACKSNAQCMENTSKKEALVKEMTSFWNEQAANGWATIGPREIVFEGKLDGKILAGGERLFVTKMPLADADMVEVEVLKEGGKAPATITLSSVDEQGRCIAGSETKFASSAAKGTKQKVALKGLKDRIVVIKVDAEKGKAFDYELRITKK